MSALTAYRDGVNDGIEWELDGFATIDEAAKDEHGWDEATLQAMGPRACAAMWEVDEETPAFDRACEEYNRGALDAIRARARCAVVHDPRTDAPLPTIKLETR